MRRVVITGLGTVNPTGNSVKESWENIKNGQIGISPITEFDASDFKVKIAGEVKNFDPTIRISKKESNRMARFTQFAVYAASEAMEDAGFVTAEATAGYAAGPKKAPEAPSEKDQVSALSDTKRFGVSVSCGIGGLPTIEEQHIRGMQKGWNFVSPYFVPMSISNMAAGQIAIRYGLKGICTCPVAACAGGTMAVGDAFHRIRDGYEDIMLAGGTESCVSELGMSGFVNMKALTTEEDPSKASIPFDANRSGFVLGEGCGMLVLEEYEHAVKRNARIYAEITGYGVNCDAYHITSPDPTADGAAECLNLTLEDGQTSADDIDYINAHGTSTHLNDLTETKAFHSVFKDHAKDLHISSTKSMTGHLLGGAGGVEAVFTALAVAEGFIPPTVGLTVPDPECDLDYTPGTGRDFDIRYAMSDSLGFGGHNACILLKKAE